MELDDQLKGSVQQHKQSRESILTEIGNLKRQQQSPLAVITPQKIEAVTNILNRRLSEATPFARAYLKASLSEIRVTDDFISLSGDKTTMARLISENGAIPEQNTVPRFTPEWWTKASKSGHYWHLWLMLIKS